MSKSDTNLTAARTGLILVLVALALEVALLFILTTLLQRSEAEVLRQVRAKAIIVQANNLSKNFYDAGVAMGGYSITKSRLFSDRYDMIVRQIPDDLKELKDTVGDNGAQQAILVKLQSITSDGLNILGEAKVAIDKNRVDVAQFRARHMYKQVRQMSDKLQAELKYLTEDAMKLQSLSYVEKYRSRTMIKLLLMTAFVLNIVTVFGLLYCYLKGLLARPAASVDGSTSPVPGESPDTREPGPPTSIGDRLKVRSRRLDLSKAVNDSRRISVTGLRQKPMRFRTRTPARKAS